MWSSRSCFSVTGDGAPIKRSTAVGGLRERDHLADVRLLRQQHDDPVDAGRESAVWRRTILERVQHPAEALLDFLRAVARNSERTQHHVGTMVPDRTARQLDAVADDVVLIRLDRQRILRVQRLEAALRHREGVVAERHLPRFRIPFVERKIRNPAELVGVVSMMSSSRPRCMRTTNRSHSLTDCDLALAASLFLCAAGASVCPEASVTCPQCLLNDVCCVTDADLSRFVSTATSLIVHRARRVLQLRRRTAMNWRAIIGVPNTLSILLRTSADRPAGSVPCRSSVAAADRGRLCGPIERRDYYVDDAALMFGKLGNILALPYHDEMCSRPRESGGDAPSEEDLHQNAGDVLLGADGVLDPAC